MTTEQLIRELSEQLTPSPPRWPVLRVALLWLAVTIAYVTVTMVLIGPFRAGALTQLFDHPRFALENAAGFLAIVFWALSAFSASVPGATAHRYLRVGFVLLLLWLANFFWGYLSPALEPSMFGKRPNCALEAYLYSVPPTIAAIWLQLRRYPLAPVRCAMYAATAAGMIPAVMMQLACMYAPTHILQHHVLPIAVVALITGGIVYGLQRWPLMRPTAQPPIE